jgi:DNA processing protein
MLTLNTATIPPQLQRLPQPPKQLFVEGDLTSLLDKPCVGIVGSRKVSPYGREVTRRLATDLAKSGVVIVSGLALGVDSIAHQAALDAGRYTIAVLPSPLETVYPASHRNLAKTITERGGALVTEYTPGTPALRHNFIARNRIIAGLSNALLVTEAALKSGSLHTARFALEQGIDVFAVPGNITSETSEGTNNLLRAGAQVATCAQDILRELHISGAQVQQALALGDNAEEQAILDMLAQGISDGNELHALSKLRIEQFNQALTMLEINGKIRSLGANHWSL